jgi:hypothetical protein
MMGVIMMMGVIVMLTTGMIMPMIVGMGVSMTVCTIVAVLLFYLDRLTGFEIDNGHVCSVGAAARLTHN